MRISVTEFRRRCLRLIDEVHALNRDIIVTKHGKPVAKLVSCREEEPRPFVGSLTGVGETKGDLLEPVEEDWEMD